MLRKAVKNPRYLNAPIFTKAGKGRLAHRTILLKIFCQKGWFSCYNKITRKKAGEPVLAERMPFCIDPSPDLDNASVGSLILKHVSACFGWTGFLAHAMKAFLFEKKEENLMEKSNQVTVSFSVVPHIKSDDLYGVVDRAIEVVQNAGVRYEVGAMETTMEGDLDELLGIIKKAQDACVQAGAIDVITSIKIHYRPSTGVTMDEKIAKYREQAPQPVR